MGAFDNYFSTYVYCVDIVWRIVMHALTTSGLMTH